MIVEILNSNNLELHSNIALDFDFNYEYKNNLSSLIVEPNEIKSIEKMTFCQLKLFVYNAFNSSKESIKVSLPTDIYLNDFSLFIKSQLSDKIVITLLDK